MTLTSEEHLSELSESAQRAGYLVTEYINEIVQTAQDEAEAIRREAERDAEGIRREAQQSAEAIRREAGISAESLLARIHALQVPLTELLGGMRDETERVSREIEREHHDSSVAAESSAASEAPQAAVATEDPDVFLESHPDAVAEEAPADPEVVLESHPDAVAEEVIENEAAPSEQAPAEEEASEPAIGGANEPELVVFTPGGARIAPADEQTGISHRLRRLRSKLSQTSQTSPGAFIDTEGRCAVCDRSFVAGSADSLALSLWKVNGDVGLCPDCQGEGWQLPRGASVPFRGRES